MTLKDKGIVLREVLVGESDKLLTVLLKNHGKLSVSARGARKQASKLSSASQPFCYSEFVIYTDKKRKGFHTLSQADVIDSFYNICNDYDTYCRASLLLEMTDKLIYPEMPCSDVLALLCSTLRAMSRGKIPPTLASCIFQLKFLQMEGFAPEVSHCYSCGQQHTPYFGSDGTLCAACAKPNRHIRFTEAAQYAVSYILDTDIPKLFTFTLSDSELNVLNNAVNLFRNNQLDIKLKSTELL